MERNKTGWVDVTESFSIQQRHYHDTFMEINEIYNDKIEVSLFSSLSGLYEVYVCYGIMYGIIRVERDKAYLLRDEVKQVLMENYERNGEPSGEFINDFAEKYHLELEI